MDMDKRQCIRPLRKSRINLTWLFTGIVFLSLLISFLMVGSVSYILIRRNIINPAHEPNIMGFMFLLLSISLLTGTCMSFLVAWIPLKPLKKAILTINEMAAGNFGVRLHPKGPVAFRELAESINRMGEELGGIEMLRKDFINDFSHEFKTPIVSMRGFAKLLRDGSPTEAERTEYLDIIIEESNRLAGLSGNILLLSRIESQHIVTDAARFRLSEQLRTAILLLEPKWTRGHVEMDIRLEECEAVGNEELLKQVWINLIDNAIKYSPEGGTVHVTAVTGDNAVIVGIADEGPGMDGEVRARAFDRFYQGDRSRKTIGNGLGLTIAQKIVQLHHGDIAIDSRPGEGTKLTVRLPLA